MFVKYPRRFNKTTGIDPKSVIWDDKPMNRSLLASCCSHRHSQQLYSSYKTIVPGVFLENDSFCHSCFFFSSFRGEKKRPRIRNLVSSIIFYINTALTFSSNIFFSRIYIFKRKQNHTWRVFYYSRKIFIQKNNDNKSRICSRCHGCAWFVRKLSYAGDIIVSFQSQALSRRNFCSNACFLSASSVYPPFPLKTPGWRFEIQCKIV